MVHVCCAYLIRIMNILVVARGIRVRKFDHCARVCILHCIGAWAHACVHASPTFLGVEKITAMRILNT